ncbi:MAG: hypothetical protein ACRELC_10180 [Gemmatimonadota bacterium]
MRKLGEGPAWRLDGLIGRSPERLRARLGPETASHRIGCDRWLVYERPEGRLRIRVTDADAGFGTSPGGRIASWTATFHQPVDSAETALRCLGLDARALAAAEPGVPLLRAALPDPDAGTVHSLAALLRQGAIVRVAAFDEPPEWLPTFDGAEDAR